MATILNKSQQNIKCIPIYSYRSILLFDAFQVVVYATHCRIEVHKSIPIYH